MVAIGFRGLQGPQVLREQRAKKVTLALQVQQGRSAQQGQQVPRDPLDLLGLGGLRDLLEVLEIHQPHPGASNPRDAVPVIEGKAEPVALPASGQGGVLVSALCGSGRAAPKEEVRV